MSIKGQKKYRKGPRSTILTLCILTDVIGRPRVGGFEDVQISAVRPSLNLEITLTSLLILSLLYCGRDERYPEDFVSCALYGR